MNCICIFIVLYRCISEYFVKIQSITVSTATKMSISSTQVLPTQVNENKVLDVFLTLILKYMLHSEENSSSFAN